MGAAPGYRCRHGVYLNDSSRVKMRVPDSQTAGPRQVPGLDVSPGPPAGHEGLTSRRHFIFVGFLRRERRLQQILLQQPHNEFADELADLHVPERRLERELPDCVLSERQFSRSLSAPALQPNGEICHARPSFIGCLRVPLARWRTLA